MPFTLNYFYGKTRDKYKLSICTGEPYLEKTISWVYLLEDIRNCSFMRGGELVITTGLNAGSDEQMLCLVKKAYEHGACGVIVNVGMYIEVISEDIIKWCNEKGFPVMTMPWEIHISDIMQEYCNEIISEKRIQDIRREALLQILKGEDISDYRKELEKLVSYRVIVSDKKLDISHHAWTEWRGDYYYIGSETSSQVEELHCGVSAPIREVEDLLHCGISDPIREVSDIARCCVQAYRAMQVSRIKRVSVTWFNQIGLYYAALAIEDMEVLKQAVKLLSPLTDTALRQTLRVYLEKNKSVQETADCLYLHRNTVNYRIQKSRSLLPDDFDERSLEYLFAFYLCDCFLEKAGCDNGPERKG